KIVAVLEDREISSSLSAVEHSVALSFRRDFEKSGIHLTKDVHSRFVVLSSEINNWSNEFLRPARKHSHHTGVPCRPHTSPSYITVPLDSLRGLAPAVLSAMLQQYHHRHRVQRNPALQGQQVIKLPVNDFTAHYILRDCTEDSVREQVYRLFRGGSDYRVQALEEVLRRRRQLARLVGYRSFAAMALHDKMLRKPEHVDGFLRTLAHQVRPNWQRLVHQMRSEKRALVLRQPRGGDSDEATSLTPLWGWDQDYLMARLTAGARDV
ncbi:Mitochondrial intermediate peptidase, partial [Spiromyces aspiralis]